MGTYSFKSSGFLKQNVNDEVDRVTLLPIGIKTPLSLGTEDRSGLFSMHFNINEQVHDNLRNLLLTNPGERLGRANFGAGLRELTMEMLSSENYEQFLMMRIKSTVDKYMPFVDLDSFGVEAKPYTTPYDSENSMSKVEIIIKYNIQQLGVVGRSLKLILYVAG